MRKLLVISGVMLTLVAAFAVACGGSDDKPSPSKPSGAGADIAPTAASSASTAIQEVTLKAGENGQTYFFSQKDIKVKPGQVKVTLTNDGPERPHNFVIKNLNGQGDLATMDRLNPGQSNSVTFTLAAGTYQFICSLPGHADRGAQGTFVVAN